MPKKMPNQWTSEVRQSETQAVRGATSCPPVTLSFGKQDGTLVCLDGLHAARDDNGRLTREAWEACAAQGVPPLLLDAVRFLRLPGMDQQPFLNKALARSLGLVTKGVEEVPAALDVRLTWHLESRQAILTVTHAKRTIETVVSAQTLATLTTVAQREGILPEDLTFEAYQKLDATSLQKRLAKAMRTCTTMVTAEFAPTKLGRLTQPKVQQAFDLTLGSRLERFRVLCRRAEVRTAFLFLALGACGLGAGAWVMPLHNGLIGSALLFTLGTLSVGLAGLFLGAFSQKAYAQGTVVQRTSEQKSCTLPSASLGARPMSSDVADEAEQLGVGRFEAPSPTEQGRRDGDADQSPAPHPAGQADACRSRR